MNELKKSIEKKSKETGVSKLDLKPSYWSVTFWKDLLNYWETNEGHLHRATVGATNRGHVERLHSAGARSFNSVKKVIFLKKYISIYVYTHKHKWYTNISYFLIWKELKKKQQGKSPTKLQVWDKCHTKVGSDPQNPVYTTPAAMRIAVILSN